MELKADDIQKMYEEVDSIVSGHLKYTTPETGVRVPALVNRFF